MVSVANKIMDYSRRRTIDYGCRHIFFGFFFLVHWVVLFAIRTVLLKMDTPYVFCWLSFLGIILTLGVLLRHRWPIRFINVYSLYWHCTLTYCLPLLSTLACLYTWNTASVTHVLISVIYIITSILLLAHLVDGLMLAITSTVGIGLALIFYKLCDAEQPVWDKLVHSQEYGYIFLYGYTMLMTIGLTCCRRTNREITYIPELLSALSKELLHYTSNFIGTGKSHVSMIDMCMKSVRVKKLSMVYYWILNRMFMVYCKIIYAF